MSTAMTISKWERFKYALSGGAPVVVQSAGTEDGPDAEVHARKITLYRPPTALDATGKAAPGISKELFGHYLVSTIEKGTGVSLPHATVNFGDTVGRFATVHMDLPPWQQRVTFMLPIGMISQEIKGAVDTYMAGVALKLGQAHRGTQDLTNAHMLFDQAERAFEALRSDRMQHYASDAECIYCTTMCSMAKRISFMESLPATEKILDRTPATERAA